MNILINFLVYLFIGLLIQLIGKVILIKPGQEKMSLNIAMGLLTNDFSEAFTEEEAQKVTYGGLSTLINIAVWPINLSFALFILGKVMYYKYFRRRK